MNKFPGTVCYYCADQNTHRDRSRGISRYTLGLLSHLRDSKGLNLVAVTSKSSIEIPSGIERISLPFKSDHLFGRLAADHFHPLILPKVHADIWHYPKGFLPYGRQVRAKRVGTIADVMLQHDADHHPESRSHFAFTYWLGVLKHSIKNLDLILTVSEFSKRSILEFGHRHQLNCPPIVVTYQGVTVSKEVEPGSIGKQDYVVHLASKLSYKATTWLLEQWSSLAESRKDLPELRLVGDLDTRGAAIFSKMANVSLVPSLPRPQLEDLIAKARALLLPSEIEGFGIPAVESYLLGTAVAYARGTALEEIVGIGSPGGFERDRDSLAFALLDVLAMERSFVIAKGDQLRLKYNWADCVQRTLEAYQRIL